MLNFDGDCDGHGYGVGKCKHTLNEHGLNYLKVSHLQSLNSIVSTLFQKSILLLGKGPYVIALMLEVNEETKTVSVLSSGNVLIGSALPVNSTCLQSYIIVFSRTVSPSGATYLVTIVSVGMDGCLLPC